MSAEENDVAAQLKALEARTAPELRALWLKTFGRPHPGWVQREFLVSALAYHLQEKACGGLPAVAKRRLAGYADEFEKTGALPSLARPRIKPGTRLVREWGGETHVVTTTDRGFEYRGKAHGSLSEIARAITGTRWSGPAFFALNRQAGDKGRSSGRTG